MRFKVFQCLLGVLLIILQAPTFGQVQLQTSNLPIVIIDTDDEIVDEPKVFGTMKIINNENGTNNINDVANEYDANVAIEIRGQTSQFFFDKKSYGLELKDEFAIDSAQSLFGMGKEEDWVLHGPYSDKSLLRNYLTFHLWSKTGRFGSDVQLCEVVVNEDYKGVYVFMENIKRDDDRVDISKLNPDENSGDDLTGGYIVKIDKTNNGQQVDWVSSFAPPDNLAVTQTIGFQVNYPKPENITSTQLNYIKSYFDQFENALQNVSLSDQVSGYRAYIDVSSFIDYSILTEINRNVDGYRLSTYMYKDKDSKDGKLNIGPPWDYNLAFGNANYCDGFNESGWAWEFNKVCPEDFWLNPFWWGRLMQDPAYVTEFRNRWNELRSGPFSTPIILNTIDSLANVLEAPQKRNFDRYPILDEWIWPNQFVGGSYSAEIGYLKSWVSGRLDWMDNAIDKFDVVLSVEDGLLNQISIYPNPVQDKLNIISQRKLNGYSIINQIGQKIASSSFQHPFVNSVDLETNGTGIYFIQLFFDDGTASTRRFIRTL